jgi:predicted amidohydrolase YtcJ
VLRIEHAFVAESRQGARIAELDIDLVVNPGLCYATGDFFSTAWRGDGQPHLRVLPVRSMMDAGARVSLASDHPAGPVAPMEIIWSAVTRRTATGGVIDEDEAITAAQALRAYTANAAHACKRADEEGSIEVGKRGTFLVLDRDIVTCAADDIREAKVDMTFVDGALVHERIG